MTRFTFVVRATGPLWVLAMPALVVAAGQVEIQVNKTVYRPGEHVLAVVTAPGTVGIQNDLQQRSYSEAIGGRKEVDFGAIPRPGLYTIRVVSGQQATGIVLFAYRDGELLRVETSTWRTDRALPLSPATLDRFRKGITRERLSAGVRKAWRRWLPANAASVLGTAQVCMVCMVPGAQTTACPACVSSAGGNLVDLGLDVLTELTTSMERDRILSPDEAKAIQGIIHYGGGAASILNAGGKLERVMEGVNFAVQTVVEEGDVTLVVGNIAGEVNKTSLLITVFKK